MSQIVQSINESILEFQTKLNLYLQNYQNKFQVFLTSQQINQLFAFQQSIQTMNTDLKQCQENLKYFIQSNQETKKIDHKFKQINYFKQEALTFNEKHNSLQAYEKKLLQTIQQYELEVNILQITADTINQKSLLIETGFSFLKNSEIQFNKMSTKKEKLITDFEENYSDLKPEKRIQTLSFDIGTQEENPKVKKDNNVKQLELWKNLKVKLTNGNQQKLLIIILKQILEKNKQICSTELKNHLNPIQQELIKILKSSQNQNNLSTSSSCQLVQQFLESKIIKQLYQLNKQKIGQKVIQTQKYVDIIKQNLMENNGQYGSVNTRKSYKIDNILMDDPNYLKRMYKQKGQKK